MKTARGANSHHGRCIFAFRRGNIGSRGYYVDTVGKNTQKIKEYIANQLEQDRMSQQITFDETDPFNG